MMVSKESSDITSGSIYLLLGQYSNRYNLKEMPYYNITVVNKGKAFDSL